MILVAPDSFKECLPAWEVAETIANGWRQACPGDAVATFPLADGGEGTLEVLLRATGGTKRTEAVSGPLGKPIAAEWGVLGDGQTAVIEMARASGLDRVPPNQRDPRRTTTRGTGELMRAALDAGLSRLIVTLGGSATNDGGAGMAAALGYRFLDAGGAALPDGGEALAELETVDASRVHPALREATVTALCDVTTPLLGAEGASAVFGPQKGATPAIVESLDAALARLCEVTGAARGVAGLENTPGAGAAGGLGYGLAAFCGAALRPGFEVIAETCGLEERLNQSELVITGEGRLDGQTGRGKLCGQLAAMASRHGVPCVALVGAIEGELAALYDAGLTAAFPIARGPVTLDDARAKASENLQTAAEALARVWRSPRRTGNDPRR